MDFKQGNPGNRQEVEIESHNLGQMDNVRLGEAIKSDFGINLISIEKIAKGNQNEVYRAETPEGKTVFIRINKGRTRFEVEIFGYKMFEQMGIPVPRVIAYQENPPTLGRPTMIISAVEGVSLDEAKLAGDQEEMVYRRVGEILRMINAVKLEGFGHLVIRNGQLRGELESYKEYCDWLEKSLNDVIHVLVSNNLINTEEVQNLYRILSEIKSLGFGQASLLHRDMSKEHIFVDQGKVIGIIDLGSLRAGDPRDDIAKCFLFLNEEQQNYFKKGYGELVYDPTVSKYLALRAATMAASRTKRGHKKLAEEALEILKKILHEV